MAGRLRQAVELEDLPTEVLGVVGKTVHPAEASLWIREVRGPSGGAASN